MKSKQTIAIDRQWHVFKQMEDMVKEGDIALPRQVVNELRDVAHPGRAGSLGSRNA